GESSCAACGVQDRVPGTDIQEAFGGRLDQQRLEIVAVTDPVVPPAGVHVPQPTILLGVFGKLPFWRSLLIARGQRCSLINFATHRTPDRFARPTRDRTTRL